MKQHEFKAAQCMLCEAKGLTFVNTLRDDDTHFAVECPVCKHVQIIPLPTIEEDNEFYQKNEMNRRLVPKSQLDERQMMLKYEFYGDVQTKIITTKYPDKNLKILEIGSGYGWFVDKMKKNGYEIDGIELSKEKREMAKQYLNLNLLSYNLLEDNLPENITEKYDIVCMFYVLEHILNPKFFIKQAVHAIKQNGRLIIFVPNFFDHLKEHSQAYNKFSFFRGHVSYYKPDTLMHLFNHAGLQNILIEGMQMYSLENAIHWLNTGNPCVEKCQIEMPAGLEWIGEYYKRTLEQQLISDGLLAIGVKAASFFRRRLL